VASNIVPGDVVVVLVVEDGETGLVVELLKAFDGDADVKLGGDRTLKDALVVVGLGLSRSKTKRGEIELKYFFPANLSAFLQKKVCTGKSKQP